MELLSIDISVSRRSIAFLLGIVGILTLFSLIKDVNAGGNWIKCTSSIYGQSYGSYYCCPGDQWKSSPCSCTETDEGNDPDNAGSCTDDAGTNSDSCVDSCTVREWYCNGFQCTHTDISAPSCGYDCSGSKIIFTYYDCSDGEIVEHTSMVENCNSKDSTSVDTSLDICKYSDYSCREKSSAHVCACGGTSYDNAECYVASSASVDCDSYDDTNGADGTIAESEVTSTSCTIGCSGSGCCDVKSATCNAVHECQYVTAIISSSFLDEVSPSFRCHRTNSGTWEWTTSSLPAETACSDGYDNDCDGKVDCADLDCSPNPPTTTASATTNGNSYSFNTWTKYDVTVTLTATDDCQVDKTYYCIDSSNTCTPSNQYSSSFTVSCSSGSVCIRYVRFYSTDTAGNSESVKSVTIKIDKTKPSTSINPNGHSWTNSDVSFTLTCSDTGSGCSKTYYKIINDGSSCGTSGYTQGNSGTVTCSAGSVCKKRVCYYSVDKAGNKESAKQSNVFYIDKSKPTCSVSSITESSSYAYTSGNTVWYGYGTGSFTVTVSASDSGSGVDKLIFPATTSNGGTDNTQPYSWNYNFDTSDTYEGTSTITVYDNAGNSNTCNFFVDRDVTEPTTTASATTNGNSYSFNTWTKYDVTVTLNATDNGTGIGSSSGVYATYYCIDSSNTCTPSNQYSSPFTVSCSSGSVCVKYVRYRSVDNVNNYENVNSSVVKIDKQPPTIEYFYINNNDQYTNTTNVQLDFSVNDGSGSGINRCEASNDNINWQTVSCSSPVSWTLSNGDGTKTVYFRVYDNVGNNYTTSDTIILDTGKPTCSVSSITESSAYSYVNPSTPDIIYYNSNGTGSFTVAVSASDSLSGIDYIVFPATTSNGGTDNTQPYSWNYNFDTSDTYEGTSTITVYDNAGNSNTCNFFVDRDVTEPTTNITVYDGNNLYSYNWVNHSLSFDISCSDSESGCNNTYYTVVGVYDTCPSSPSSYNLSTGGNITIDCSASDPYSISGYDVCEEKICVYGVDNVNNNVDLHDKVSDSPILIDKQKPNGTIDHINTRTGIVNDIVTSVDTVRFLVHADDYLDHKSGLSKVEFYIIRSFPNGTVIPDTKIYENSTLNGVSSASVYSTEIGPFKHGQTVTYYAKIYDRAGNVYQTIPKSVNILFGINCTPSASTRITALTTWDASSEIYYNSNKTCGDPSKVVKQPHNFTVDYSHRRYKPVYNFRIYNITDLIAYAEDEDYCVWIDSNNVWKTNSPKACHLVGETFMLDNNYEVQPRGYINTRLATCIKGSGVANDNPVLVSNSEVPNGFVFLPSNEHYFHVMWNVNYSTNPRLVGIKCYFNPHKTDTHGHIYWCTSDEIENGSCPEYQLCECSGQWPCYQDTNNQTVGTCTVLNPEYLVNVTGFFSSGWPIVQFVENKIFCKFYDPNFENETYTWYNHNFTPIAFSYNLTIPNNTQLVVGTPVNLKIKITNIGVINDIYNITATSDSPALSITPSNHETSTVDSGDYVDVYFLLKPNCALNTMSPRVTFTICSEKMESVLPSDEKQKACKKEDLRFTIKMITMDDNPFSWIFNKII